VLRYIDGNKPGACHNPLNSRPEKARFMELGRIGQHIVTRFNDMVRQYAIAAPRKQIYRKEYCLRDPHYQVDHNGDRDTQDHRMFPQF
jgi:hypothetical protein